MYLRIDGVALVVVLVIAGTAVVLGFFGEIRKAAKRQQRRRQPTNNERGDSQ